MKNKKNEQQRVSVIDFVEWRRKLRIGDEKIDHRVNRVKRILKAVKEGALSKDMIADHTQVGCINIVLNTTVRRDISEFEPPVTAEVPAGLSLSDAGVPMFNLTVKTGRLSPLVNCSL